MAWFIMYKCLINLPEFDLPLNQHLVSHLLFDFKDNRTLKVVDDILHEVHPGDYCITQWANRDDNFDMSVYAEFKSKEEYFYWFFCSHQS